MLIIPTVTQDELALMDAVDVHNLLAGPVDYVRVTYHCGNTEDVKNFKSLLAIRDRLADLRAVLAKRKPR